MGTAASPADRIFVGGPVVTVTEGHAEAVAIADGTIVAVGTTDDVLRHRTRRTDVVDLAGQALLPGLIEPHTHPDLCAQCYAWVDVSGFSHRHVADVERALVDAVATTSPGEWIFAFGLDPMLTTELGTWNRDRLDAIAPDHPLVVMIQSMHTLFVNSRALEAAGIDENTPDPPAGHFGRDDTGRLTGRIEEIGAIVKFAAHDAPSAENVRRRIVEQYERYRDVGITTIGMAGAALPRAQLALYPELAADPATPLRIGAYLTHHNVGAAPWGPGDGSDRFRALGVKFWYDGSPYSGTMLLDEPYLASELCCCTLGIPEGTIGKANFEHDELIELVTSLGAEGWQIITHAQGDRGCREMLDLYEEALGSLRPADHRWRLEHCALMSHDDLRRAARLGVAPSFHVNHVLYYGPELEQEIIGTERAAKLMPVASAIEAGLRVSLHADSPMYPPGPLSLIRTAVTRHTRLGEPLAADQAIDVGQALRAVTIDAAWQLRMDDEIGSIEAGKRADFTLLEADPLRVEPLDIDKLAIEATYLDGVPTGA